MATGGNNSKILLHYIQSQWWGEKPPLGKQSKPSHYRQWLIVMATNSMGKYHLRLYNL